jgi:hypothetical protein
MPSSLRRPLFAAALVSLVTIGWACSSGDPVTTGGDAGTDAGVDVMVPDDGGSDAEPDSASDADVDAGPQKPAECEEFTLATPLLSSQHADPESYLFQPDLNATPLVGGTKGDPKKPNVFLFFLDGENAVGTFPVTVFKTYWYASGNSGGMNADYVKPGSSDAGASGYTRYAAVSGTVEITSLLTPHQTKGKLSNVRFDEATLEADGTAKLVPNGKCQWLKEAEWDTQRPLGCAPFTKNTCGDGKFCMPTNAIGDDGLCVTTGTKVAGDVCTPAATGLWDSDCAAGLRCAKFTVDVGETEFTCHQLCDVRSDNPGCPATAHCGGGYDACLSIAFLHTSPQNGDEIDTGALVGQDCALNPTAIYCGVDGRPGTCVKDKGAATSVCRPLLHAASQCPADMLGGYLAYKAGNDSSSIFCTK